MPSALFQILLCLYFFQCNGTPPNEVATRTRGTKFTDQEDDLILRELLRLALGHQQVFSNAVWEHIADTHRSVRKENPSGFPQERSAESLRSRFRLMLMPNQPQLYAKVPENLLKLVRPNLNRRSPGNKGPYSEKEENLIRKELLKDSCTNPFAPSTLEALGEQFEANVQARTSGFKHSRTVESIRRHIYRMIENGQLPSEVLKKLPKHGEGASNSGATSSNKQTASEGATKARSRGLAFTEEEEKQIIDELSSLSPDTQISSQTVWANIERKSQESWQNDLPGFPQKRTSASLRRHFRRMVLPDNSERISTQVPEHLLERFRRDLNKPPRGNNPTYTPEEERVIIKELLQPSCTGPYAAPTLKAIHAKLQKKWNDVLPGFQAERTLGSVRSHIRRMKKMGTLPQELQEKFQKEARGAGSSTSSRSSKQATSEGSNEDEEEEFEEDEDE